MQIVIIGTGGMAKEIWGLCYSCFEVEPLGFVADKLAFTAGSLERIDTFMGLPILALDAEFLMEERRNCVIANGTPDIRRKIAGMYLGGAHNFPNIIHHAAAIFGNLDLGLGITIMPGGVIQPAVRIDDFVHINGQVFIGHDVAIGKYSVINHRAGISGNVKIGEACLIGAGATIIEGNTIGDGATVGAGAVITKNVPPGETWVGVPARCLETKSPTPTYAELYGVP